MWFFHLFDANGIVCFVTHFVRSSCRDIFRSLILLFLAFRCTAFHVCPEKGWEEKRELIFSTYFALISQCARPPDDEFVRTFFRIHCNERYNRNTLLVSMLPHWVGGGGRASSRSWRCSGRGEEEKSRRTHFQLFSEENFFTQLNFESKQLIDSTNSFTFIIFQLE